MKKSSPKSLLHILSSRIFMVSAFFVSKCSKNIVLNVSWNPPCRMYMSFMVFLIVVGLCVDCVHIQSCPTPCDSMDSNSPGSVNEIFLARILE